MSAACYGQKMSAATCVGLSVLGITAGPRGNPSIVSSSSDNRDTWTMAPPDIRGWRDQTGQSRATG